MTVSMRDTTLSDRGWIKFPPSPALRDWIRHAAPAAAAVAASPEHDEWYRHGRTWFVGVNALPNDELGALASGPPLAGDAVEFARALVAPQPLLWDRGQVSICHPSYPQRDPDQSEASHLFRVRRDAAHVDGLYAEGANNRRYLREPHAFILGIPLAAVDVGQSPVVVYERSHHIMREAFTDVLGPVPADTWHSVDLTDAYHAARRKAFETCARVEITTQPGEVYLIHRLALHGMAPWTGHAGTPRTVIYFRPMLADPQAWLA